jgi:hypothetical protein
MHEALALCSGRRTGTQLKLLDRALEKTMQLRKLLGGEVESNGPEPQGQVATLALRHIPAITLSFIVGSMSDHLSTPSARRIIP